nr:hypothetical protein BaRGS_026825 [Batillaria attramentaria]
MLESVSPDAKEVLGDLVRACSEVEDEYKGTEKDLHDMMKEILPEFIKKVDPREDGFLDTLYASYLLTDTDNESLSGKDVLTRKDQARKLWFILNKIPLEDFMSKVAPELCKKYGHIIPKRFRQDKEQDDTKAKELVKKCLRHAIQSRIRATSMADMLYHKDFLDFEDYGLVREIILESFRIRCVY